MLEHQDSVCHSAAISYHQLPGLCLAIAHGLQQKKSKIACAHHAPTRTSGPALSGEAALCSLVTVLQGHGDLGSLWQGFACSFPGWGQHAETLKGSWTSCAGPSGSD